MLCTFERKILGILYGSIQDKGRWRPGWNSETFNMYKDLQIVDDMKIRRLGWARHVVRMADERIQKKKVLNGEFHNTRPVGKPRTRWEDVIRRDTPEILGIRGWRRRAEDREKLETSSEGSQGPKGAVASQVGVWKDDSEEPLPQNFRTRNRLIPVLAMPHKDTQHS